MEHQQQQRTIREILTMHFVVLALFEDCSATDLNLRLRSLSLRSRQRPGAETTEELLFTNC